jgi:hypothetical protein
LKGSKVMASENWGWNWWNQSKYKVFNDPQGVCIWLVKPFFLFTPAGEWMCIPYGIHPHRSMDHDSWRIFAVAWWHVHSIQYNISDMYMIICICICICICKCMYVVYIYIWIFNLQQIQKLGWTHFTYLYMMLSILIMIFEGLWGRQKVTSQDPLVVWFSKPRWTSEIVVRLTKSIPSGYLT